MLRSIKLSNFKCFESLDLPCAPLTLLCGLNGMGKSSVIQALLALRQSIIAERYVVPDELILGGALTDLGTGADVLFEDAQRNFIGIELRDDKIPAPYGLNFEYVSYDDRLLTVTDGSEIHDYGPAKEWGFTPPIGGELFHIEAERIGPRKHYPLSETAARRGDMGSRSELTLSYWNSRQNHLLAEDDPRCSSLKAQNSSEIIDHWLGAVSPGAHLLIDTIPNADALLARFSFDRPKDVGTSPYRATNVGFGLSYSLPVLIALLASPGTLCLIENPEAHLHPQGQTKMAELAVRASMAGVQVIAETHSDHFMDGVRIAVHDGLIPPEETAFHYFERVDGKTVVSSPQLDANGRLSSWPTGFFNQHAENMARLLAPKS